MTAKKQDTSKWIETLLAAHPAKVADAGFSARVIAEISRQEKKRYFVLAPFFVAGFVLLLWFFPAGIFAGLEQGLKTEFQAFMPYLIPAGAAMTLFLFSLFSEEAA